MKNDYLKQDPIKKLLKSNLFVPDLKENRELQVRRSKGRVFQIFTDRKKNDESRVADLLIGFCKYGIPALDAGGGS